MSTPEIVCFFTIHFGHYVEYRKCWFRTQSVLDTIATSENICFSHNHLLTPWRRSKTYVSYTTITFRQNVGLPKYMFLTQTICDAMATSEQMCFSRKQFLTPRRAAKKHVSHTISFWHHVCHDLGLLCKACGSLKGSQNLVFRNGLQWAGVCEKGALMQSLTSWFLADSYRIVADLLTEFDQIDIKI